MSDTDPPDAGTTVAALIPAGRDPAYDAAIEHARDHGYDLAPLDTLDEAVHRYEDGRAAALLLDLSCPPLEEPGALDRVLDETVGVPTLVVVDAEGEPTGPDAVARGAQDYIARDTMTGPLLVHALRCSIERKRLERGIRDTAETYQSALEGLLSPFAIFRAIRDDDGVVRDFEVVYVNPAAAEDVGIPRDRQVGRRLLDLLPAHADSDLFDAYVRVVETGEPFQASGIPYHDPGAVPDGVSGYYDLSVVRHGDGFTASWHDVSGRRQKEREEEAHRRTHARYRALIENAADVITILARDGRIVYESPAVERMLGHRPDQLVGRSVLDIIHPEEAPEVQGRLAGLAGEPGAVEHGEARLRHQDGSWRTVEYTARNALDDPAIQGIVVNTRDVSAERTLEDQFRQAQKMEAVGRLAGGIAHDFNNMLTGIIGFAQLAAAALPDGHPSREDIDEVKRNAERAADLTRQLLVFSRRSPTRRKAVDLVDVVAGMEKMLSRVLEEHIHLQLSLPDSPLWVTADPTNIEQVIMNLAVNARDAMADGGTLEIQLGTRTLREEVDTSHGLLEPGVYAVLSVTDTGAGMPPGILQQVFEPFFTTKEQGKGTGLGLSTVWGIVTQSGGRVHVYSEPGEGTAFRVYLPCIDAPPAEPEESVSHAEGVDDGTVLVVEDNDAVRDLARRVLRRAGYDVLTAESGDEAERVLAGHGGSLDLLLTDLVMPGMGGVELARRLRKDDPGLRVLYASGYRAERLETGMEDPHFDFLEKPFGPDALLRAVRKALAG